MKIYKLGDSQNNRLDKYPKTTNNFDRTILAKGRGSNRTLLLQASWVWNSKVTKLVESLIEGYTLNCPCGASELGDVRGDLYPIDDTIQVMDMNKLPFADSTFDTVIHDPPWKINFFHRQQPFKEGLRVLKGGGAHDSERDVDTELKVCEAGEMLYPAGLALHDGKRDKRVQEAQE